MADPKPPPPEDPALTATTFAPSPDVRLGHGSVAAFALSLDAGPPYLLVTTFLTDIHASRFLPVNYESKRRHLGYLVPSRGVFDRPLFSTVHP